MHRERIGKTQRAVRFGATNVLAQHLVRGQEFRGIFEFSLQELRFLREGGGATGPVRYPYDFPGFSPTRLLLGGVEYRKL